MKVITQAKDLEVGKYYFWASVLSMNIPGYVPTYGKCEADSEGHKYLGQWRIWAFEGNDQFTGSLIAVGPIEAPNFKAICEAHGFDMEYFNSLKPKKKREHGKECSSLNTACDECLRRFEEWQQNADKENRG